MRLARAFAVLAALILAAPAPAEAASAEEVVTRAGFTVDNFLADLPPDDVTRVIMQNAYGVLIVPGLIKAGFVLGAEHGLGVLLVRDTQSGRFGPPTFFEIFGGSVGFQIGAKSSDTIWAIMNPKALNTVLNGDMNLGGEFSLAVLQVGGTYGAGTTTALGEDIYVFERPKGLFGGASLEGSGVLPNNNFNESYWGSGSTPESIARQFNRVDARSSGLREALLLF